LHILLVDDIPFNLMGLELLIQRVKVPKFIEKAYNGEEAVEKIQQAIKNKEK